jgi:hypothetical protein
MLEVERRASHPVRELVTADGEQGLRAKAIDVARQVSSASAQPPAAGRSAQSPLAARGVRSGRTVVVASTGGENQRQQIAAYQILMVRDPSAGSVEYVRCMRYGIVMASLIFAAEARADPLRLDGSLGLAHFQQQAKPRVGTPRGERLVEHTAATLSLGGAYDAHRHVAVAVFGALDLGVRRAADLAGFDADGRATIDPAVGGESVEVWLGVAVRGQWRGLFADLGYALFARRWDTGRDDLPAADGGTGGAFAPELAVRWLAAVGGTVRLRDRLALVLRLEWRIRYYDERDGQPLMDGIVHGTQEFRPLVGLAWRPPL